MEQQSRLGVLRSGSAQVRVGVSQGRICRFWLVGEDLIPFQFFKSAMPAATPGFFPLRALAGISARVFPVFRPDRQGRVAAGENCISKSIAGITVYDANRRAHFIADA
jgi:hypothetical protein